MVGATLLVVVGATGVVDLVVGAAGELLEPDQTCHGLGSVRLLTAAPIAEPARPTAMMDPFMLRVLCVSLLGSERKCRARALTIEPLAERETNQIGYSV